MPGRIFLFLFHRFFLPLFLRMVLGVRFLGLENVQKLKNKQFFIAANHNSHMDTLCILSALTWKQYLNTKVVAAQDYFGGKGIRTKMISFFFRTLLIPRKRPENSLEPDPIEIVQVEIRKGHNIVFFPEGSRGVMEELAPFKMGIGYILKDFPKLEVLPVFADGLGFIFPKGSHWLLPHHARVKFGVGFQVDSRGPKEIRDEVEFRVKMLGNWKGKMRKTSED
ncbi:MAG: 1-acyl-sn-glycerol-3-phosphate acyltransferase [Bacteroidia bacterium]|nr:1-acyl-sn-glycerol-3-phosphate acyltransferase [Bacteroidia bacterium]